MNLMNYAEIQSQNGCQLEVEEVNLDQSQLNEKASSSSDKDEDKPNAASKH